jgi:isovaleryl-CoA dehydrogenase
VAEVEPAALAWNRREEFNQALFVKLGGLGLLGMTADPAHGGAGMDATAVVIAHEELAASDPALCLSFLAHSLLFVNNLAVNGSPAQKAAFLPRACAGELLCGMAMSEPGAGTDVLAMRTRAARVPGSDDYELSGAKMWITNGARSEGDLGDAFLVYAATGAAAATGAGAGAGGGGGGGGANLSLFLVEKGMPGFSLGYRIKDKCGMRASNTAELVFDRVRVPASHRVGAEGTAVASMMRNLEVERLGLAAMSLGIARRSIEVMNAYARERRAFGAPINRFGQVQRMIADSYAEYAAGKAYVYATAAALADLSAAGNRIDSDGVKLYCARMATEVANRAMQVLGGNGYVGEYVVERLWRDAKLLEIGGGTSEAHEKNMARDLSKVDRLA